MSLRSSSSAAPLVIVLMVGLAAPRAARAEVPETSSPGGLSRVTEVGTSCPTFSWGTLPGAARLELIVLDLASPQEPKVVLRRERGGTTSSWTPDRADCLRPGGTYGWTLRPLDGAGRSMAGEAGWASVRRFSVPALPGADEVAAALAVLRRWQAAREVVPLSPEETSERAAAVPTARAAEVSGTSAIRGENPAASGASFGVWGQSASTAGAGLVGLNTTSGPDLVLDGAANGQVDTAFTQAGIDRPSASAQSFTFQNSGGGGLQLYVGASLVSTAGHLHAGSEITSGVVADARLAATIARDSEILPAVFAGDGAGSTLDADLLDGLHGQNYQRRVTGLCGAGETLQGINADGTVVCALLDEPPTVSTVDDPPNQVGMYTSLALGSDGLPVIAYRDMTVDGIRVMKCDDAACAGSGETIATVVDSANDTGYFASLAIAADGLPVIAFYDFTAGALMHAKCSNPSCTGSVQVTTVDDPGNVVGSSTALTIGTNGFAVIAYQDETAGALKVARCLNAYCTSRSIAVVDDLPSASDLGTSIVLGTDGYPVIAYRDQTAGTLKVAKCHDSPCSVFPPTITTVDDPPANVVGGDTSIAIGSDGFPVISYYDQTATALRVAKCNDIECVGGDETITTVDGTADSVGTDSSIAIGADGFPVVAYRDGTNAAVRIARCNDHACSGHNETITTIDDSPNLVGQYLSLAVAADGFPVMSYHDWTAKSLKVAKCHTRSCFAP